MVFEDVDDDLIENIRALVRFVFHIEHIEPSSDSITFGDYEISFGWRKMFCKEQEIPLARIEFDLLAYFAHNRNRVLTYDQIIERRYEKTSTAVTPNKAFFQWDEVFADAIIASAFWIGSCITVPWLTSKANYTD